MTDISEFMFYDIPTLTTLKLGGSIKLIPGHFANRCPGIKEIVMPASVDSIGEWAFRDTPIKKVVMEDGPGKLAMNWIGGYGVFDTDKIEELHYGRNMGNYTQFYNSPLRKLTIGKYVTEIGSDVGSADSDIEELIVPSNVRIIADGALKGIRKLILEEGLEEIGEYGVSGTFTSLHLPGTLRKIGNNAFANVNTLTDLEIRGTDLEIGYHAFHGNKGLTGTLVIPTLVRKLDGNPFADTSYDRLVIEPSDTPIVCPEGMNFYDTPFKSYYIGRQLENISCGLPTLQEVTIGKCYKEIPKNFLYTRVRDKKCYKKVEPTA